MSSEARAYNDSAYGARTSVSSQIGQAPSLGYELNGKLKTVRFDGFDGKSLIDRKLSVVTTEKAKNQALRQSAALEQNGYLGRWEVPNKAQVLRARKMFEELGIKNIEVSIVKIQ